MHYILNIKHNIYYIYLCAVYICLANFYYHESFPLNISYPTKAKIYHKILDFQSNEGSTNMYLVYYNIHCFYKINSLISFFVIISLFE